MRLCNEIRREIAPYIGISWIKFYGETKDINRAIGVHKSDVSIILCCTYSIN